MSGAIRSFFGSGLASILTAFLFSGCYCGEENDAMMYTGKARVYALYSVDNSDLHGFIKFIERRDSSTLILVYLKGTSSGNRHPALIHSSSAEEKDDNLITLNQVNGKNGISETLVKQKNDGSFLNYAQLIESNGHVTVHLNDSQMEKIVAKGNIGGQ